MFSFTACGGDKEEEQVKEYTYEIGMLTAADEVSIDDEADVQAAWEGVRRYAEEHNLTYKYYEAAEPTTDAIVKRAGDAVKEGVKVIVASGPEISEGIYAAQKEYDDVKFVYLDGVPKNSSGKEDIAENCIAISFNPLQAGFLAGYSAVLEGFNSVGYMADDSSEEAKAYGYGFLQGCNTASDWFNRYTFVRYRDNLKDLPAKELKQTAETWFDYGVDAIFAYGEDSFDAAKSAASAKERVVIASNAAKDYNKTVITSAMKCYQDVVCEQLDAVYNGSFTGGKSVKMSVKDGGIGLDMKNSKFTYFNNDLYKEIIKELSEGKVELVTVKKAATPAELVTENRMYYISLQE